MKIVDNDVFSSDMKELIWYPIGASNTSYTVPEGVEIIGVGAFQRTKKIKEIILPSSLKVIK